jgi:hypothetical protein
VKQTAFFFGIFSQTVRILVDISEMDDHMRPFLPLDPVDCGQCDPTRLPTYCEVLAQPKLECRYIVVQRREVLNGGEVVALSCTIHSATVVVKRADGTCEPDAVNQSQHQV